MKKLLALILALTLLASLCACRGTDNNLTQEKLAGTWSVEITMNELLVFYAPQLNEVIGFGDLAGLAGSLPAEYTGPFLLVFDGQAKANAYLDTEVFNIRMLEFTEYLLTESVLLQVLGLQGHTTEQIGSALGGLSIEELSGILQLQFSSADFAGALAQQNGYEAAGDYLKIPIADSYTIENNRVLIHNGYLQYNGTDLLLTEDADLTSLGFNLTTSPITFCRESDKTEY